MQDAYPQDFVVNGGLLLRILRALAHCPLEMLHVFSLHVAIDLSLPPIAATTTASSPPHSTRHHPAGRHTVACRHGLSIFRRPKFQEAYYSFLYKITLTEVRILFCRGKLSRLISHSCNE